MAEKGNKNDGSRMPDISFGGGDAANGAPRGSMPPDRRPGGTARPAGQYKQVPPPNGVQRTVKRGDMPRGQGQMNGSMGGRGQEPVGNRQPVRSQSGGRPPIQNGRPAPRNLQKPPLSKGAPARSASKKGGSVRDNFNMSMSSSGAAAAAVKKKFTKKQAMQVTGLILMLILIFGLAAFLIFNHYFSLLDHSNQDVSNSAPITYSDVDFSRPDTFEKAVEDEKLKELTAEAKKITSDDVMNILLIGEDLRDTTEERTVGNTDVMMLISVNKKDKTITLTSLMRDCYVYFEDDNGYQYSDRINSAYWYGGIKLTKQTVENYMKVKIDRYVLVNFRVFIDIVDALGGIDMHVTDQEANGDPNAPRSDKEHRGMQNPLDEQNKYLGNKKKTDYIKKGGDLHLNGNQALAYARLRYVGDADFDRTKRQRKVINEMIKESRSMSLVQMDQLATKVFPQVKTDVTRGEVAGLLLEMLDYRNYKVQEIRVPADDTFTNEFIDGKAVLSVDFPANVELFRKKAYGTVEYEYKEKEKSENGKALE